MKRLFEVDGWKIIEQELHKEEFRLGESMLSLGNGHMGIRGNFEESYTGDFHSGSYVAGVWFPDKTRVGWWKNGYPNYFGKVINATNFIGVNVFVDEEEVDLYKAEVSNYYRELDMQHGVLTRRFTVTHGEKETDFEVVRFLSVADKELGVIQYRATPKNYEGIITFVPYLDGDVRNEDSNYEEDFWEEIEKSVGEYTGHLVMKTVENPFGTPRFQVGTSMKVTVTGEVQSISTDEKHKFISNTIKVSAKQNETVSLTKYIAVTTDRDYEATSLVEKGKDVLLRAVEKGYDNVVEEHCNAWLKRWENADVTIGGDEEAQQGIRFNIFQLFSTYFGEDSRLNIGPKGFTGEKYGGSTYWDTEAYCLPMYLSTTDSSVSRNLLIYRYNQLENAKVNARRQGLKGALYPMVTMDGLESHNEWEITFEEIHRNGAIAHAIYNYTNYTGDKDYLHQYGFEVLAEISRFWADRVHYHAKKKVYMMHGVTGPSEYDNNVNNNWYTNRIAVWTLEYTLEVMAYLEANHPEEFVSLVEKIGLQRDELDKWGDIIAHMYYPVNEELGIFEQHDGYLDKELMPVSALTEEDLPLCQNWSWDKILRSCFIKQADVLQGLYFLNDKYSMEEKKRNFDFYEPMTAHESSLSPSIYSIIASEIGYKEKAHELYLRTARLDLDNYNNDTEDGLHITSMTGSWLSIVQGFARMRTANERLSFAPFIPEAWNHYTFTIMYRDHHLKINVTKESVIIEQIAGSNLSLYLYEKEEVLSPNGTLKVALR